MENCIYQGKIICTFDLKDSNGYYYEDQVLAWKQAAADRQLTCTECNAPVYLAAGPIKEPYFAHYDLKDCDYGNGHESEELKKGKRLLYQLLKRSFPKADIQARFRMENGLYSTLYCILEDGRSFAVDYRLQNNSLEKFRERDTFYQANRIKPIYVMGKRQEKDTKQIDWYQSLLQNSMGFLIFLDTEREQVTLKRSFGYRLGNTRKFAYYIRTYPVKELNLDQEGQALCDFSVECSRIDEQIKAEKLQFQKRQEQLKVLREEQLRQEEKYLQQQEVYKRAKEQEERERQEAYRRAKEQEKWEQQEDYRRTKELEERERQEVCQRTKELEERERQKSYRRTKEQVESEQQASSRIPELKKETTVKPETSDLSGLNPAILEKCRQMVAEGNAHLVSKKYYDAIMNGL